MGKNRSNLPDIHETAVCNRQAAGFRKNPEEYKLSVENDY